MHDYLLPFRSAIITNRASNIYCYKKQFVDFNGVGFVPIESSIFGIFGVSNGHPRFLHSIEAKYYISLIIWSLINSIISISRQRRSICRL